MSSPLFNRLLAVGAALSLVATADAQLAAGSPFLPPAGARDANAPTSNAPLEFRGVADLPGGLAFRVVDPARKAGAWVRLNEPEPDLGFVVKQHDAAHETVVVEHQGRTFTLLLHQSKVAAGGAPMPLPLPTQNLILPPSAASAAVAAQAAPTAIQQQQLEAVAAAVAQRRALREQAQQQVNQSVPLALQLIQQQQQQQRAQNAQNAAQKNPGDTANQDAQRAQKRRPE